jgi:ribosomal protein S18 acetylase RimI-like enzyme
MLQSMRHAIRRLEGRDAEILLALRQRALAEEPFAFLSSPEDDLARDIAAMRLQLGQNPAASVVFGAFEGEALVGMIGWYRERHLKSAHKSHIWGVYVRPDQRRRGMAGALLATALAHARALDGVAWVQLSVSERSPAAKRVYERAGFFVWGLEPDCIRHGGETAAEFHLALSLARE